MCGEMSSMCTLLEAAMYINTATFGWGGVGVLLFRVAPYYHIIIYCMQISVMHGSGIY